MSEKMLDWGAYRKQLNETLGGIARVSPDILKGNEILSNAAPKPGTLDAKTRELIALAVAVRHAATVASPIIPRRRARQGRRKRSLSRRSVSPSPSTKELR